MIVCLAISFSSCKKEDYASSELSESSIYRDLQIDTIGEESTRDVSYYIYKGISATTLFNYYGHVFQDRTFVGWKNENTYTYTPNTSYGYPHPTGITNNDYELVYNKNCGLAAYVMARGLAYKEYSLFALQPYHGLASSRRYNTKIYCETSMRLHRAFPNNYNFGTPKITYLFWMAKGDALRRSDVEFLLNPSNPAAGAYPTYFSANCGWSTENSYKTELENCMDREAPFVTIVRINDSYHPAGSNRHDDNAYTFSGTTDVGNYIGNHTAQHYIVVVAMRKAFDSNDNFLENQTIVYFLDPYYDYRTIWHTTYSKLVSSAYLSASQNRNGFGLYRPDLE